MKAPPGKLQLHTRKRHPALINQISSYSGRLRLTIKLVAVLISSQSLPDFCQPFQGSWTKIRWIETTTLLHHYHPVTKFLFPPLSLIIKPVLCGEKTYRMHQVHLSQGQTLLPSWHKNFVMQANNPTQGAHTQMAETDEHSTALDSSPVRQEPALVVDHAAASASRGLTASAALTTGLLKTSTTACAQSHVTKPRDDRDAGTSALQGKARWPLQGLQSRVWQHHSHPSDGRRGSRHDSTAAALHTTFTIPIRIAASPLSAVPQHQRRRISSAASRK